MDELMLSNLTFCRLGMGGGGVFGNEVGSAAKQERKLKMLDKLTPIWHVGRIGEGLKRGFNE